MLYSQLRASAPKANAFLAYIFMLLCESWDDIAKMGPSQAITQAATSAKIPYFQATVAVVHGHGRSCADLYLVKSKADFN